jgi:DDE superfamily endonuclease
LTVRNVRPLIEARGCQLLYLPAYSPDLTPIEQVFSKLKAHLRRLAARTREALLDALASTLATVTPEDAHAWFCHAPDTPHSLMTPENRCRALHRVRSGAKGRRGWRRLDGDELLRVQHDDDSVLAPPR